ncbi:hypothetical protein ACJMK2_012120 [Sinanodonta woodiana]|uniref:Uncharacterized protein n=1 Tax=Sinanodonta woodiana TaxID=1069815 RepID=A0ABD3V775_SINWO
MFLYQWIVGASVLLVCFMYGSSLKPAVTQRNHSSMPLDINNHAKYLQRNHSSMPLDINHQAKHFQGNDIFQTRERKSRDVEAQCRNTLGQRAICHWTYQTDFNITREPAVIQKVVCSSPRVFLNKRMITCETVYTQMIFRRANCIGDDCSIYQSVPVGCVAAEPCIVQ